MIFLTKKKQRELLKILAACQIIANHAPMPADYYISLTDNLCKLTSEIGGADGLQQVHMAVKKYGS